MNKYLLPQNYVRAVRHRVATLQDRLSAWRTDPATIAREEHNKFKRIGWDETAGLKRLNEVLHSCWGQSFNYHRDSVHWLILSCISLSRPVKRVLEIGTFTGSTTAILSQLFPNAEIVTIDLPDSDPILRATYGREDEARYDILKKTRKANLAHESIRFVEVNSFFLCGAIQGSFDLIWVDGGHRYPEVAWDLCNAWSLCDPGGIILCDDIVPYAPPNGGLDPYVSSESHQVIKYLQERISTTPVCFRKRRASSAPVRQKYVCYLEKPC